MDGASSCHRHAPLALFVLCFPPCASRLLTGFSGKVFFCEIFSEALRDSSGPFYSNVFLVPQLEKVQAAGHSIQMCSFNELSMSKRDDRTHSK